MNRREKTYLWNYHDEVYSLDTLAGKHLAAAGLVGSSWYVSLNHQMIDGSIPDPLLIKSKLKPNHNHMFIRDTTDKFKYLDAYVAKYGFKRLESNLLVMR